MSQLHRNELRHVVRPQRLRTSDPEFTALAAMCTRLIHEKAALEERVEQLEAELADYARDEQARQVADRAEAEFQMLAMAGDVAERAG